MLVQDRIVQYLQNHDGLAEDAHDVADRIAAALGVPGDRVRSALDALEKRGFLFATFFRAELTDKGRAMKFDETEQRKPQLVDVSAKRAAVTEPDGRPGRESSGRAESPLLPPEPSPAPSAPPRKGSGDMQKKKQTNADAIVARLTELGGTMEDPKGRCTELLASALSIDLSTVRATLNKLVYAGVLTKDARRGAGTKRIALVEQKGAALDGQVQELSGGDRVRADNQGSKRPARRKARASVRPKATKRGPGRRSGAKGGAASRRGRRRDGTAEGVGDALLDLPDSGAASQPTDEIGVELAAIRAVAELTPPQRSRAIAYLVDAFGVGSSKEGSR